MRLDTLTSYYDKFSFVLFMCLSICYGFGDVDNFILMESFDEFLESLMTRYIISFVLDLLGYQVVGWKLLMML